MKGNGLIVMLFIILATIFLNIDGINGKVDHIELKVSIKTKFRKYLCSDCCYD